MSEIGGYKTRQRERILRLLTENAGRHLSVDEVVDHLRGAGWKIDCIPLSGPAGGAGIGSAVFSGGEDRRMLSICRR